jgi:arylsulfatase A-like enzyme
MLSRALACLVHGVVVGLALLLAAPALAADGKTPTNIVFILADDLGWTDLGCQGSRYYETPNLDRLAREGVRFSSAYTCGPNCQPTRAALLTGRYGPRTGIYTVGAEPRGQSRFRKLVPVPNRTALALEEVTIAEVLKDAGYATGMFGKWHLGPNATHHPTKQGFDEAIVSMGKHFAFNTSPPVKVDPEVYLADFLTDRALGFIEKHRERPFFLYLPHFAVHSPLEAKKDLIEKYRGQPGVAGHQNPVYAAMIESVDQSVGRVLARLDELKLADRTVVIFSSDNGGVGGYAAAGVKGARDTTNNAPLRGGKGMLYEGGIRVPLIVRWPGVARPGGTCDEPVASVDFLPTFAALAGAKVPADRPLDGVSFLPLLRDPQARLEREALYWHFPGYLEANVQLGSWRTTPAGAIRAGDWKLQEFLEDGRVELYNLKDDLGEKTDLSARMPQKAHELRQKLHAWREKIGAPMPKPNPEYIAPK